MTDNQQPALDLDEPPTARDQALERIAELRRQHLGHTEVRYRPDDPEAA